MKHHEKLTQIETFVVKMKGCQLKQLLQSSQEVLEQNHQDLDWAITRWQEGGYRIYAQTGCDMIDKAKRIKFVLKTELQRRAAGDVGHENGGEYTEASVDVPPSEKSANIPADPSTEGWGPTWDNHRAPQIDEVSIAGTGDHMTGGGRLPVSNRVAAAAAR